jgi:DNA-binding LacI/PurR family transcriptional regulator
MTELAREAGVSVATVSRLIAAREPNAQGRGR